MKKLIILFVATSLVTIGFAQCTTTIVSSTSIITYPAQPTTVNAQYFWVCSFGSLTINGFGNTVYIEQNGSATINGEGNTVYLRGGTVTFQGTGSNGVIHTPGSTINNLPAGTTPTECPTITLHYTSSGGCINVGIEDLTAPVQLNITPNPAFDRLSILVDDNTQVLSVRIMDLNGRLVMEDAGRMNMVMDVSTLGTGLYTCIVETDRGTLVRKVMKE